MRQSTTIKCTECNRKLANIGQFTYISIKCQRCKAVNTLRTESSRLERQERHNSEINDDAN